MALDPRQLDETLHAARNALLAERCAAGYWPGELSSSALSTATAVTALACADARDHDTLIRAGLAWLAANVNEDGGWGDTTISRSNLSTTTLARAAFAAAGDRDEHRYDRQREVQLSVADLLENKMPDSHF